MEKLGQRVYHVYDGRLTAFGDTVYVMFAMDMEGACHLGLASTKDFRSFTFLGITTKTIRGMACCFRRRSAGSICAWTVRTSRKWKAACARATRSGFRIVRTCSHWTRIAPLISGRFHYWDELIGSGPPPVKTRKGWLHIYHGVADAFREREHLPGGRDPAGSCGSDRRCSGGAGATSSSRARSGNLPDRCPNVVFPSGMIVEQL